MVGLEMVMRDPVFRVSATAAYPIEATLDEHEHPLILRGIRADHPSSPHAMYTGDVCAKIWRSHPSR